MKLALKFLWLLLSMLAVLSLFMPGNEGMIAGIAVLVLYLPLSMVVNWLLGTLLEVLHGWGWGPTGDTQWLVVNVAWMLLLSGVGYLQWFMLFPRLWRTLRPRRFQPGAAPDW